MSTTLALVSVVAIGLVAPFGVRSAAACSPQPGPPGYGSLVPNMPRDGATDAPTNGVVVLEVEIIGGQPKETTLSVVEGATGALVPGAFQGYYWSDRTFVVWRPAKLFQRQTSYRVAAAVTSEVPRPSKATGAAELSIQFTTGSGLVPGIEAQGQLQVKLETYTFEREDWSGCQMTSCGPVAGCAPRIEHEERTRARVTVPSFSGGLSELGYHVLVPVTADTPYYFPRGDDALTGVLAVGSGAGIRPNAPSEVLVELDQLATHRPCFALRATDLAGTVLDVDPVCLATTVKPVRNLDQAGGCRVAGQADAPTRVCSALGLLWYARRRRRLVSGA